MFEDGYDRLTNPQTGALVEYREKFNNILPRDPFISGSWALEQGDNRSAHLNARYQPSRFYLRQVNHVTPVDGPERDDALHQDYDTDIFEIGGDITRSMGGGAIKLVGLVNRRKGSTFDDYLFRGLGGSPILVGFEQFTDSTLSESVANLSWSKSDVAGSSFETGAEVAYNDPLIPKLRPTRKFNFNQVSVALTPELLAAQDAVVTVTDHSCYDYGMIVAHAPLVISGADSSGTCVLRSGISVE